MEDLPPPPEGVTLRDPEDSSSIRKDIEDSVLGSMDRYVNGYAYGGVRVQLKDLKYVGPDKFSKADQQDALMSDRLLHRRLRGTLRLVDDETNEILDEKKNLTLARVPFLTERGTFIDNGSEFSPVMQSRLLPGAYTRRRVNGELETHFNVRPGTGSAMRMTFDPSTAQYRLKVGSSNLHAYSVFKDLGVTDEELERRWGPEILATNKSKYSRNTLDRLYKKAVPKWERDDKIGPEARVKAIRDSFDRAQVAESILKQNLPNLYNQQKAASWRMSGRAIEVMQNMVKEAANKFEPDLDTDQIFWQWLSVETPSINKSASFDPDIQPEEMREAYNSLQARSGPHMAGMREWPAHWLDDQDNLGWLQWYKNYSAGRRSETDDKQIQRWKSFKSRHGASFVAKPTPRRGFALMNWGIDPVKMLPKEKAPEFQEEMEQYRRKEYMKWFMNRHDFDTDQSIRLGNLAATRGASKTKEVPGPRQLMTWALDGYIKPEDLK